MELSVAVAQRRRQLRLGEDADLKGGRPHTGVGVRGRAAQRRQDLRTRDQRALPAAEQREAAQIRLARPQPQKLGLWALRVVQGLEGEERRRADLVGIIAERLHQAIAGDVVALLGERREGLDRDQPDVCVTGLEGQAQRREGALPLEAPEADQRLQADRLLRGPEQRLQGLARPRVAARAEELSRQGLERVIAVVGRRPAEVVDRDRVVPAGDLLERLFAGLGVLLSPLVSRPGSGAHDRDREIADLAARVDGVEPHRLVVAGDREVRPPLVLDHRQRPDRALVLQGRRAPLSSGPGLDDPVATAGVAPLAGTVDEAGDRLLVTAGAASQLRLELAADVGQEDLGVGPPGEHAQIAALEEERQHRALVDLGRLRRDEVRRGLTVEDREEPASSSDRQPSAARVAGDRGPGLRQRQALEHLAGLASARLGAGDDQKGVAADRREATAADHGEGHGRGR